jgi:hypothetical protein
MGIMVTRVIVNIHREHARSYREFLELYEI